MINLIRKRKRKRKNKERKHFLQEKGPEAFRPTIENKRYLDGLYNKSSFINRSISFYILLINKPIQILKELKMRSPKLYKFVGRKKFE